MNMSENACLTTEGQLPIVRWRVLGWRGCQQDWAASAPLGPRAANGFFLPATVSDFRLAACPQNGTLIMPPPPSWAFVHIGELDDGRSKHAT